MQTPFKKCLFLYLASLASCNDSKFATAPAPAPQATHSAEATAIATPMNGSTVVPNPTIGVTTSGVVMGSLASIQAAVSAGLVAQISEAGVAPIMNIVKQRVTGSKANQYHFFRTNGHVENIYCQTQTADEVRAPGAFGNPPSPDCPISTAGSAYIYTNQTVPLKRLSVVLFMQEYGDIRFNSDTEMFFVSYSCPSGSKDVNLKELGPLVSAVAALGTVVESGTVLLQGSAERYFSAVRSYHATLPSIAPSVECN